MKELTYQVRFSTPAFLGNAEQQAQWRTPPFKALIRQWWRVARGPNLDRPFDVDALRREEGALFGTASDDDGVESGKSLVRLRLKHWGEGQLGNDKWPKQDMRNIRVGEGQVRADVYLGFGPIVPASKKLGRPEPMLERRAIEPQKATNELKLGFDRRIGETEIANIQRVMQLIAWFGGVGSRSRNGWGSLGMKGEALTPLPGNPQSLEPVCQPLKKCFDRDWPHAIGSDGKGPLVWVGRSGGQAFKHWRETVYFLATLRRDIRAAAKAFGRNRDISANQLIAYPVTKSGNSRWGDDGRFASPLRFKVIETDQGCIPVAVHLPSAVPGPMFRALSGDDQNWVTDKQLDIWRAVHAALDERMIRLGAAQ